MRRDLERPSAITASRGWPIASTRSTVLPADWSITSAAGSRSCIGLRLLLIRAPPSLKLVLGKRYFLNGWAGCLRGAARTAFYAFLKYAKVLEAQRGDAASAATISGKATLPSGWRLKRRWIHRYCAGAARTIASIAAITRAVSAVASCDGKSSNAGDRRNV